jgi:thymidylate synthase
VRILICIQGPYGERIVENIERLNPGGWRVESFTLPTGLPAIMDAPSQHLSGYLPETELIIFLSESSAAGQLIPHIARITGAKGVIAPIDNKSWLPLGLKGQVQEELNAMGVGSAFPKNFCTLTESTYGYGESAEPYECEMISSFAKYFGRPRIRTIIDPETGIIQAVDVQRGSPCGSTYHTAKKIVGMSAKEAVPKAGLVCVQYPCLATMEMEQIDKGLYNTLMHLSGQILNEELEAQTDPSCRVSAEEGSG